MFAFAPAASGGQTNDFQDFTAFGLGTQVGFAGFTFFGGAYNDMGRYGTVHGQNKAQNVWSLGGKYEFDKVAVGASWLNGEGYDNLLMSNVSGLTSGPDQEQLCEQLQRLRRWRDLHMVPGPHLGRRRHDVQPGDARYT